MTDTPVPRLPIWRAFLVAAGWGVLAQAAVALAVGWLLPPGWRVPALSAAFLGAFTAWRPGWLAPGERRASAARAGGMALLYLAGAAIVGRLRGS